MKSNLGLGLLQAGGGFGFWQDQVRRDSLQVLHLSLRSGITHFDTAQTYGNGRSEQMLGQQCKRLRSEIKREDITYATKIQSFVPEKVETLVSKSLSRLLTDYLDILYLHWPTTGKDPRLMLEKMKQDQRVKHIGCCNLPLSLLKKVNESIPLDYFQTPISLLWTRDNQEKLQYCADNNIQVVGYSPLGMGLLSNKHRTAPEDGRANLYCYQNEETYRAFLALLDLIEDCAKNHTSSAAQIALSWSLTQGADTILTGSRNKKQLEESLVARNIILDKKEKEQLQQCAERLSSFAPKDMDNIFNHKW